MSRVLDKHNNVLSKNEKKKFFEWDYYQWSESMMIWRKYLENSSDKIALEIGARNGGLSIMLSNKYDINVICTDLTNPEGRVHLIHHEFDLNKISFKRSDVTSLNFDDNTFDIVVFKSVLGGLKSRKQQLKAIREIYRVLKPGGVLLFAENLVSSKIHQFLRKKFIKWSKHWRYLELKDLNEYLFQFKCIEKETTGFFSNLLPLQFLKYITYRIDMLFIKLIPKKFHYLTYGAAIK